MSIHGILGEHTTDYPTQYRPELLYPIARRHGREAIGWQAEALAVGIDWWQAYEVSWLDNNGVSQVAIARFGVPASSPYIVESKSLKLYLNSLNFTTFASWEAVQALIAQDLSECVQAPVTVTLFAFDALSSTDTGHHLLIAEPEGICIDDALSNSATKLALSAHPEARLLAAMDIDISAEGSDAEDGRAENSAASPYHLYSNLLRSNCPVTNQPDWGTVAIRICTDRPVKAASVLAYILSYRQHNGFHEQCVEQIFADLSQHYQPTELMVRAWYTRRGGIDINPCRVSDQRLLPKPSRLIRQ